MSEVNQKSNIKKQKSTGASRVEVADAEIIRSQEEAALLVGRSTRTIRRYEREGMQVFKQDGKKVYLRSQLLLFAANEGKQPTKTKMKKEEAEASIKATRDERERMELEILKGEWVKKEETERDNLRKIMIVKRALLGQGRKLAMQLAAETNPRKIQKLLDNENRTIIEGFAR